MGSKKYYWLKLRDDFFTSKRIKKLRNMAGGDTYVIIYLKMQLLAMKTDGILRWTGLEDKFADELALDLDEKPDDVEVTLLFLLRTGLAETSDNINFFLPFAVENTGKESSSAERVRAFRAREKESRALQCNANVTACNTEIDIEKEKESEIEEEDKKRKRFKPPTVDDVSKYCRERANNVDPQHFVDYYTANGWKVGKNPMKDWKAAVRTWERNDASKKGGGNAGQASNSERYRKSGSKYGIVYD
jgi:predicted phage replisome organizer